MSVFAAAGSLIFVPAAGAQADDWQIHGSNTLRVEDYDINGNVAASPYQFEGSQYYDEFNVSVTRKFSPFRNLRAQVYGVANHSDYRFDDNGLKAERVSVLYENGEGSLPYRVEAGDFYSYLSYRTVQRSMKGTQLELQSKANNGAARHSLIFFAGVNQNQWDDIDFEEDGSAGASWLVENAALGSLSLNFVYNQREGDVNLLDAEQWVVSLAGETNFDLGEHNINVEGEYAYFDGDHDGDFSAADGQNRDDHGFFSELSGAAYRHLSYRLRFEEYGFDYRPQGSVVVNDRRSYEAHLGWQFDSGVGLRGRWQTYEDRFDSVNQLDTEIVGLDLSGNFFQIAQGYASGRLRAYQEWVTDEFNTVDRTSSVIDGDISAPLTAAMVAGLNVRWLDQSDDINSAGDATTTEIGLELNHRLAWGDFTGSIAPGIRYRDIDGNNRDSREWTPTLAINLSNAAHTFRASYDYLDQDRSSQSGNDLVSENVSLHYHYTHGQHELGLDVNLHDRQLNGGADTDATRVSAYWTYYIDRRSNSGLVSGERTRLAANASLDGSLSLAPELLTRLAPGQTLNEVTRKLLETSAPEPATFPDAVVYEMRLFSSVDQRQRIALAGSAGTVDKVGLIIDFENDGRPQDAEQLFEEVREDLIRQFGRPSRSYERGDFSGSLASQVNSGRLIRVAEWETSQGTLRFGIPRRLDGNVRMEVQHAGYFSDARDTLWSIETVR
ncbi:MAG: hypothetical protein AB8C02_16215 [Halioglobus sp.]